MIVITNGRVIDPANKLDAPRDILVRDGTVGAIDRPGAFANRSDSEYLDAAGMLVVPGLIDLHVHLREPGYEWKETIQSGSEAAILGGFTTICSMPNTDPVNDSAEITKFVLARAALANAARVLPIGAVSIGLKGLEMAPLSELRRAGCVAFSDDGEPVYDAGLMRRALEWCLMIDAVISCHEEDKCLSARGSMNESALSSRLGLKGMPTVAEDVMVARDIELARYTGGRVHICHVSSARSVELVRRAKNDGIRVTAEVTPHHLVLTEDAVRDYDTNSKMSPPLRKREDVEALIAGIKDGTLDAVASDHAPHEHDSKQVEFGRAAFGILGLQTSLPLLLEFVAKGTLSIERAIALLTSGPAKAFGLPFGTLTPGVTADITVIDPARKWSFDRTNCRSLSLNSPFIGRELCGAARDVMVGGNILLRNGALRKSDIHNSVKGLL